MGAGRHSKGVFTFIFMHMSVCMYVCVCAQCPQRSEAGIKSSRTGVTDGYGLLCGCWELNLGPLQE